MGWWGRLSHKKGDSHSV